MANCYHLQHSSPQGVAIGASCRRYSEWTRDANVSLTTFCECCKGCRISRYCVRLEPRSFPVPPDSRDLRIQLMDKKVLLIEIPQNLGLGFWDDAASGSVLVARVGTQSPDISHFDRRRRQPLEQREEESCLISSRGSFETTVAARVIFRRREKGWRYASEAEMSCISCLILCLRNSYSSPCPGEGHRDRNSPRKRIHQ